MSKNQRGFTLVELLLATAFFGFILIFVTAGFVQISRSYNKGITVKRVQETTRQIVDEISRTMLLATSSEFAGSGLQYRDESGFPRRLCVGGTRFAWNQYGDTVLPGNIFTLVRDYNGGNNCFGALNESESVELVDSRLTVQDITITQAGPTSGIYKLCVIMSTNSSDLLTTNPTVGDPDCEYNIVECNIMNGDQFCDVAKLKTVVTLRN